MPLRKVLSIDPGGTTGWAVIEGRTDTRPYYNFVAWGGEKGWTAYEKMLEYAVPKVDVVVVENFILRPEFIRRLGASKKWVELREPTLVGVARGWAKALGKTYISHEPSDLAIGRKLEPRCVHKSNTDPFRHAKDALAHAVLYNHRVLGHLA